MSVGNEQDEGGEMTLGTRQSLRVSMSPPSQLVAICEPIYAKWYYFGATGALAGFVYVCKGKRRLSYSEDQFTH